MQHRKLSIALTGLLLATSFTTNAADHVFSNTATITNNDSAAASPYPSNIAVTGLNGNITDVSVTLHGISHTWVGDLNLLLVAPNGQTVALLRRLGRNGSGFGSSVNFSNADITFSASAGGTIPLIDPIPSGTYLPSGTDTTNSPAPAPAGPYSNDLTTFNGTASGQNGNWQLFLSDHAGGDTGSIAGGWTLNISDSVPATTCASEGYTGTKLNWCQIICESESSSSTIETYLRRWINRYHDLPYCAVEGGGEEPPQEET